MNDDANAAGPLACLVKFYIPVARTFLLHDLRLPPEMVGAPRELSCYLDGRLSCALGIADEYIWPMQSNKGYVYEVPRESACYAPAKSRLFVASDMIEADARDADLSATVLTEILVAHECVHALMMGQMDMDTDRPSSDWIKRDDLRHIHESVAMRFCEKLPGLSEGRVGDADVANYLRFVALRSATSPVGVHYARYFAEFSRASDADLWTRLSAGIAVIDDVVAQVSGEREAVARRMALQSKACIQPTPDA